MEELFYDVDDNSYSYDDIKCALYESGAFDCDTIFIHSDVMFGRPAKGFKRKEYLEKLYGIVQESDIKNIIVPTFTYSFPNNEEYDITNSKTPMGAFNEYIRKLDGRYRTDDPILSVSVPDVLSNKFKKVGEHSLGKDSAFDILHSLDDVKFLFFGAEMGDCFTYVHYVEKMMEVPYRFDMPFEGYVIYPDGKRIHKRQYIHTQCSGAKLPAKYDYFESEMEEKGYLKKKRIADKYIACLSEKDAYREIKRHIDMDINYFLETPFHESDLIHKYTYSTNNGRITHC